MFEGFPLKLFEAGLLLVAGGLFAWWQLADVKREQTRTRARREALRHDADQPPASPPQPPVPPRP